MLWVLYLAMGGERVTQNKAAQTRHLGTALATAATRDRGRSRRVGGGIKQLSKNQKLALGEVGEDARVTVD